MVCSGSDPSVELHDQLHLISTPPGALWVVRLQQLSFSVLHEPQVGPVSPPTIVLTFFYLEVEERPPDGARVFWVKISLVVRLVVGQLVALVTGVFLIAVLQRVSFFFCFLLCFRSSPGGPETSASVRSEGRTA